MTRNDIINLTVLGQVEAALDMNSLKRAKEVMEQRNKGLLMLPKSIQKRVDDFVNRYNEANESQAVEESFEDDFITYTMTFDVDVEKSYKTFTMVLMMFLLMLKKQERSQLQVHALDILRKSR